MKEGLHSLLKGMIDYAGLFPPAQLMLNQAISNYAHYKTTSNAWMLSKFVIPVNNLADLKESPSLLQKDVFFDFSVTGSGGDRSDKFLSNVESDVGRIKNFGYVFKKVAKIVSYEVRLPAVLLQDQQILTHLLFEAAQIFETLIPGKIYLFYESVIDDDYEARNTMLFETLVAHNDKCKNIGFQHYLGAGFKLRCGGNDASMFPSAEEAAFLINEVRKRKLKMKCTAGLHHPTRHFDEAIQVKMHGFLNIFVGGIMSQVHDLNDAELKTIIEDEDVTNFRFTDESISWKNYSATNEQVRKARSDFLASFGSCSFEEPLEDLTNLGLLP